MKKSRSKISPHDVSSGTGFGAFYTAHCERFVRYAYYYLNCRRAAEDIAHDAILYYWEKRRELAPETDVLGYILLTVRNKCLNYLKHIQLEAEHVRESLKLYEWEVSARIGALEEEHYAAIFTSEMERIVRASLSELPAQTRRIFVLHRFRNRSRKEIAAAMNVSQQKVDYHVNKATEHLYRALKDFIPAVGLLWHVFFCDGLGIFPGWVALYI